MHHVVSPPVHAGDVDQPVHSLHHDHGVDRRSHAWLRVKCINKNSVGQSPHTAYDRQGLPGLPSHQIVFTMTLLFDLFIGCIFH